MTRSTYANVVHEFLLGLSEELKDPTLPSQQVLVLTALYIHGDVNQSDLEDLTGVKRSANSRNITKLGRGNAKTNFEGPELVEKYEDRMNQRANRVRLTPKGRAIMDKAIDRATPKSR